MTRLLWSKPSVHFYVGTLLLVVLAACATPPQTNANVVAEALPSPVATATQPAPATATAAPTATNVPPTATPVPTPGALATRDIGYVPILMYHYVREVDADADPLGFNLSVRPDRFAEQMAWLHDNDYTPMRMSDLAACLRAALPCPERAVALTFDDGYADQFEDALPALKRYNFPATFYIATNLIGQPGYMTWDEVREMHAQGMEIGAHTMSHADLTGLDLAAARTEIVGSKAVLEKQLSSEIDSFSYPVGSYNAELAEVVRKAGYTNAVTTQQTRTISKLFEIPRRRVLGGESIAGYPWYFTAASLPE